MARIASSIAAMAVLAGTLLLVPSPAQAAYGAMIQPVSGRVSSIVDDRCSGSDDHRGIDITGNEGSAIKAAAAGTVETVAYDQNGYGHYVVIRHAGGYKSLYAHMVSTPSVAVNDFVPQGRVVGNVGNTGNSFGAHLHFEVTRNDVNVSASLGYACGQWQTQGSPIPYAFPGLDGPGSVLRPGDINGDAIADLLAIRNDGYLVTFFGNGNGGIGLVHPNGPGWGNSIGIVHGDYDMDGAGDVLQVRSDGGLYFYKGNYASGFTPTYVGAGWANFNLFTGGVDFTGDGLPDLVVRGSNMNLYAYPGNGAGSFGTPVQIGQGWSGFNALVAGDFNKDGRGDIMARNAAGDLWGYFGTPSGLTNVQQVGWGWSGFSTITGGGDHNGDSNPDVVARRASDNTLWLYPGNGNGGFGAGVQIGNGWGSYGLIT